MGTSTERGFPKTQVCYDSRSSFDFTQFSEEVFHGDLEHLHSPSQTATGQRVFYAVWGRGWEGGAGAEFGMGAAVSQPSPPSQISKSTNFIETRRISLILGEFYKDRANLTKKQKKSN
jgi:hypothetical protein